MSCLKKPKVQTEDAERLESLKAKGARKTTAGLRSSRRTARPAKVRSVPVQAQGEKANAEEALHEATLAGAEAQRRHWTRLRWPTFAVTKRNSFSD